MLFHQSEKLSGAFSDEQDKWNVIWFCISSISVLKMIWDSSINTDGSSIGHILLFKCYLKNTFSNNGEKISSYRWVSVFLSFLVQGCRVMWSSLGNLSLAARGIPGAKAGMILLLPRLYVSVQSSKAINYSALWNTHLITIDISDSCTTCW